MRTLVDPGDVAGSGSVDGQFGPDRSAVIAASQHANGRSMTACSMTRQATQRFMNGRRPGQDLRPTLKGLTGSLPPQRTFLSRLPPLPLNDGGDLLRRARQVRRPAHGARVALCIVQLIAGLLAVSGASFAADTRRFDGEGGDAASTLPEAIRNGLRLDEFVLSCNAATPRQERTLTALKLAVYRIDFDSDGRPDWLVAGTDPCLRQADGLPWWGFAAMAIDEGDDEHGDGPRRILKAIAEAVQLEDASATGYADLPLYRAGPDMLYRYADGRYVAQASSETSAGSPPVPNGDPMWAASPRMLADFRVSPAPLDELGDGPETQRLLRQAFGAARPPLLGSVTGAFTSPTARETLLLVRAGGPRAAAQPPFGQRGTELLRYVDGELSARHALAPQAGNAIVAAPDPDGDGMQILLMRNDDMNMGMLTASLILLRLTLEQAVVLQVFKGVREDGCGGPPSAQKVSASIVYWQGEPKPGDDASAYVLQRFVADCPEANQKLDAFDFEAVGI